MPRDERSRGATSHRDSRGERGPERRLPVLQRPGRGLGLGPAASRTVRHSHVQVAQCVALCRRNPASQHRRSAAPASGLRVPVTPGVQKDGRGPARLQSACVRVAAGNLPVERHGSLTAGKSRLQNHANRAACDEDQGAPRKGKPRRADGSGARAARGPGPRRPGAVARPREGDASVRGVRTVPRAVERRPHPSEPDAQGGSNQEPCDRRAWRAICTEVTGLAASAEGLVGLAGLRMGPQPRLQHRGPSPSRVTGGTRRHRLRGRQSRRLWNCPWATTVSYAQGLFFE